MNRSTDSAPSNQELPDSSETSLATAYTVTDTARPEADVAAEERARAVAQGLDQMFPPTSPSVRWVRVGDLLPHVTAAASGRGIHLHTELTYRARQGSFDALKSAGRTTGALAHAHPFGTLARLGDQAAPQAHGRGIQ